MEQFRINYFRRLLTLLVNNEFFYNIQPPFPKSQCLKPLASLSIFSWKMFWQVIFPSCTISDIYNEGPSCHVHKRNHRHCLRIPLIRLKFHSDNRCFAKQPRERMLPRRLSYPLQVYCQRIPFFHIHLSFISYLLLFCSHSILIYYPSNFSGSFTLHWVNGNAKEWESSLLCVLLVFICMVHVRWLHWNS